MANYTETKYGIKAVFYQGRDKKGKNIRISKTFPTKKEAERWVAKQLLHKDNSISFEDSRMPLKDFMEKWHKGELTNIRFLVGGDNAFEDDRHTL